ncbi:hypothetical protein NDU88_006079 [Pleurodeles waltl]|uniref:Uncharacterized protein n=1 Tax=Pleurodeles waltl TaxID=8319 RepID=A0AAV7TYF9_PLEWA|nr:hypothetical protein NDU88_006079 [Pleurodeles waltl]
MRGRASADTGITLRLIYGDRIRIGSAAARCWLTVFLLAHSTRALPLLHTEDEMSDDFSVVACTMLDEKDCVKEEEWKEAVKQDKVLQELTEWLSRGWPKGFSSFQDVGGLQLRMLHALVARGSEVSKEEKAAGIKKMREAEAIPGCICTFTYK